MAGCFAYVGDMNVTFVVGTLARGGAEKQLVFMLRALKSAGIRCRVLCLTKDEAYENEINDLGTRVEWVGDSANRVVRLSKILAKLRNGRTNIVQSSHFYTNIYAGAAGRILRIPSIGAVRSDLTYEITSHRILGAMQISLPHCLITNSQIAYRRLLSRGTSPERIEFVRNVVANGESRHANGAATRHTNILFAGRLDANKRPERFVRMASVLNKQFPQLPLRFQIAGDGELRGDLQRLALDLGLSQEKLTFLGLRSDMEAIYRNSDILVSTSDREGTPNVILEAMAHGIPVVATKVGGTAEILNADRGLLVDPNDESGLVNAAAALVTDCDLRNRLGSEGIKYVSQHHSLASLQEQLSRVYEKLLHA
ncbi:MAG: glycosyltransferase [Pyrinomonadaceae bacterium]